MIPGVHARDEGTPMSDACDILRFACGLSAA